MFANIINITATKRDWKRAGSVKSPKGTNAIASGETRRNSDTIVAVPEGDERAFGPFQGRNQSTPTVRRVAPDAITSVAFSDKISQRQSAPSAKLNMRRIRGVTTAAEAFGLGRDRLRTAKTRRLIKRRRRAGVDGC